MGTSGRETRTDSLPVVREADGVGNLYAARGGNGGSAFLQWREGEHKGFLESLRFTGRMVNMGWYEEAWYCETCRKLVLDAGLAMERAGPNYVWENGKVKFPTEELDETKEI